MGGAAAGGCRKCLARRWASHRLRYEGDDGLANGAHHPLGRSVGVDHPDLLLESLLVGSLVPTTGATVASEDQPEVVQTSQAHRRAALGAGMVEVGLSRLGTATATRMAPPGPWRRALPALSATSAHLQESAPAVHADLSGRAVDGERIALRSWALLAMPAMDHARRRLCRLEKPGRSGEVLRPWLQARHSCCQWRWWGRHCATLRSSVHHSLGTVGIICIGSKAASEVTTVSPG